VTERNDWNSFELVEHVLIDSLSIVDQLLPAILRPEVAQLFCVRPMPALIVDANGEPSVYSRFGEPGIAGRVFAKPMDNLDDAQAVAVGAPDLNMDVVTVLGTENLLRVMYHCGHILT
jgi:hypothetical protein